MTKRITKEYNQKMTRIRFVCVVTIQSFGQSWFITGFVCNKSNTTCAACGAGRHCYLLEHPSSTPPPPGFKWGSCCLVLVFCLVFCISLFGLLTFFFTIVLSFLPRFTVSSCTFGVLKLFVIYIFFLQNINCTSKIVQYIILL